MTVVKEMPDIVIAAGDTSSQTIKAREVYGDAVKLGIMGGTTIDGAKTYTVQVSDDEGTTWYTLQEKTFSGAAGVPVYTDRVPPATTKAQDLSEVLSYSAFKILANGAVAAGGSTWTLNKKDTVYGA